MKGINAIVILISVVICTILIGSFFGWYKYSVSRNLPVAYHVFIWAIVISNVWQLMILATRRFIDCTRECRK